MNMWLNAYKIQRKVFSWHFNIIDWKIFENKDFLTIAVQDGLLKTNVIGLTDIKENSISDPSNFDVDPDPGIHIWENWILIPDPNLE